MALFKKYGLLNLLLDQVKQIDQYLQKTISDNKRAPLTAISINTSNLLVSVNTKLATITNSEDKQKLEKTVANISVRILLSAINYFPGEAENILEAVSEALKLTAEQNSYKYSNIEELMNLGVLRSLLQSINGSVQAKKIKTISVKGIPALQWMGKCHLDFLTDELKSRQWIKSRAQFSKLFDNEDKDLIVNWNMSHKYELARLLFRLHQENFIRGVRTTRGFFVIAETHIRDDSGKKMAKNSLRKISNLITSDLDKYSTVVDSIEEIMDVLETKSRDD